MGNVSTIRPDAMKIPLNYPTMPEPGKITLLWDANKKELYHRLSPYGYDTFLGIKTRQPFQYTYPDEAKSTPGITDIFTRSITDVERVSKYMISQSGLMFLTKQFLMQTGNAFNETRIYNPSSPIVAAGMPLTLWTVRPQRNIDTGDLLGSLLGPLGKEIRSIFTTAPPRPPAGTLGNALPPSNLSGGKGLLRAGTANKAKTELTNKWTVQSGKGLGLGGFITSTFKSLFYNFIPHRQDAKKRSDELAYGLMLGSSTGETGVFSYQGASMFFNGVQQYWFGGGNGSMRDRNQVPLNWKKIYVGPEGLPILKAPSLYYIISGQQVGYQIGGWDRPVKYGDYLGTKRDESLEGGSDVLIQHSMYIDDENKYPSKLTDKQSPSVKKTKDSLARVIDKIKDAGIYSIETTPQSSVTVYNQEKIGYDRIASMKSRPTDVEGQYSILKEYRERNVRVLENQHTTDAAKLSLKTAGTNQFDAINTLTVLDGSDKLENYKIKIKDSKIANWTHWDPYADDLIAFYFYDVVNDKYIPFRATLRGLQETDSTNWEEFSCIGRADRIYSYGGFNRSLTFSFTVHINSIMELSPTWQRINYLMSLVKPANYTQRTSPDSPSELYTRYMIPPMVMITIGDLYKNQPIVIGSAGISIPDSATWETLNEKNSPSGWSYLANYITCPKVGKLYAQLPKTAEISINAYVLEKERAIVGAAHFGHSPHDENYERGKYRTALPDNESPGEFHKSLVVYNDQVSRTGISRTGDINTIESVERTA